MSPARTAVAIVGGGISGLAAAFFLEQRRSDVEITLFEASSRLGGKLRTEYLEDVAVEGGADWFLTRAASAVELCRTLELEDRLVTPAATGACIWTRGRLRELPQGFVRGIPISPLAAWRAGILSGAGAARAAMDVLLPGRLSGEDVSIGALVRRRFGRETLDRLVDPMIAAARSGRVDDISLSVGAPEVDAAARSHRSVILGLKKQVGATGGTAFVGLEGGMSSVIDRLRSSLRSTEIKTNVPVRRVIPRSHGGFGVEDASGRQRHFVGVLLAVPAFTAGDLLVSVNEQVSQLLRTIYYNDAIVAALVYPPDAGASDAPGSGFLVPSLERRTATACAWYSRKWPHARPHDDGVIVRCFVGRTRDDPALQLDDAELVRALTGDVEEAGGPKGPPRSSFVVRWDKGIPQYRVGHLERVRVIDAEIARCRGLELAGAGYAGAGIPDCIASAERAVDRLVAQLPPDKVVA